MSETTINLRLTYSGLVAQLAENVPEHGYQTVRDLPELSLEDLAAALQHYPTAFADCVSETEPDLSKLCCERLGDTRKKVSERYAHVGLCVVGFIRAYLRPLVLRDVQLQIERNRDADAIEAGHDLQPTLTYEQFTAGELGLGRTLS